MKAYDFEFNNKRLCEFGMIIANFGDKGLDTIDGAEITFNTIPTFNGSKSELVSVEYENNLESTIQIVKYSCSTGIQEITANEYRSLTKWLSRKGFYKLKFFDENHIDLYYNATFSSIGKIELDGLLMGLELHIVTNSPHAFKDQKTITINCEKGKEVYGWKKYKTDPEIEMLGYVTSTDINAYPQHKVDTNDEIIYGTHTDGYQYYPLGQVYKASLNDTSYEEGYIYPQMKIVIDNIDDRPVNERNLTIHNSIENRDTYIANCKSGEVITLDYPVIQSSDSSHNIQNDFNWTFFRVANTYDNSRNDLVVSLPCSITIKYSPIVKVGI